MRLPRLFQRQPDVVPVVQHQPLTPPPLKFTDSLLQFMGARPGKRHPFVGLPTPPPGVRPPDQPVPKGMAMDDAISTVPGGTWGSWAVGNLWGEGLFFPGYPYLSELSQRPEYRNIVETLAEQMTRKWVKLNSTGDEDKSDKIEQLEAAMKRFGVREAFHKSIELDGFFGMGMLYIDIDGVSDNPDELATGLLFDDNGQMQSAKMPKGKLRGFVPVEPLWCSPQWYNSTDPLKPTFFVPEHWYVMGKRVHASRLLIFRSREVPDILKASYNFGGLSLSQLAKPYVDNWLRTRQSVSDLIHSFTQFVLKTNLGGLIQNTQQFANRVTAMILGRDNQGFHVIDKESEELENVAAPLSGLDKLQAQAQEQLCSVSQEPLIWALGLSPTGLNATAEPEIRVFYDRVKAKWERMCGANLTTVIQALQLNEFGSVDDGIGYEFLPLWELDEAGRSAVDKTEADADSVRIADGVISPEEVRTHLASDPLSRYHGLEGPPPDPPALEEGDDSDTADQIERRGAEGSESGANSGV